MGTSFIDEEAAATISFSSSSFMISRKEAFVFRFKAVYFFLNHPLTEGTSIRGLFALFIIYFLA
jgi:hypothetical protein